MKPTDFSKALTDFLSRYLPAEKGVSRHTVCSYKDTFILLLNFLRKKKEIQADGINLGMITKELIVEFLSWIQTERNCRTVTRNVRLAAIHSFFRYLQYSHPENMLEWQRILSIPFKKSEKGTINYLTLDGVKLLLSLPNQKTARGRRDLALLSLMYDCGARVQEIIDLTPVMLRLDSPSTIKLMGKGGKARIVPLMEEQIVFLKLYMSENKLFEPYANNYPLFYNNRREKLTRAGVNFILCKYAKQARDIDATLIPDKLSCHSLRHSKAMHLLQAGVNLVYIRDILGHSSVVITEHYAKIDSRQKREAIEKAYTNIVPQNNPPWLDNDDLLCWLKGFVK
jgi:site-specific recombinase XerD